MSTPARATEDSATATSEQNSGELDGLNAASTTHSLEDSNWATSELRTLVNKYNEPQFTDCLQRLRYSQGSQNVEEWARRVYVALRNHNDASSLSLNEDRKTILKLIYELVDLWNKVRDKDGAQAADAFEDEIIRKFKLRRIEQILGFGVAMDRAQALYSMKIPTWSQYGMHWYSKYHFDSTLPYCNYDYSQDLTEQEQSEWQELLQNYPGRATMNKRLFQLLFSKKMGLRDRFPATLGRWSKPQSAEFVDIQARPFDLNLDRASIGSAVTPLEVSEPWASRSGIGVREKNAPPEGFAVLVFTDIQDSTALSDASDEVYGEALNLHNEIMRGCIKANHGYEVATEGDAFHVAFHEALDAVQFALAVQEQLYNAPWSKSLLALPQASNDRKGMFRGLRVRVSIHQGPVTCRRSSLRHGRVEYSGETYYIAREVEGLAEGGQIVVTSEVWRSVNINELESSPQVIDLGLFFVQTKNVRHLNEAKPALAEVHLFQLVPKILAFDYRRYYKNTNSQKLVCNIFRKEVHGRQFRNLSKYQQLTPGFNDAPKGEKITICFLYMAKEGAEEQESILGRLAMAIEREAVTEGSSGYQCKDNMLAFANLSDAVRFGLKLQRSGKNEIVNGVDLKSSLKIGLHEGRFQYFQLDPTSGRVDYFGKLVNRAARVASATKVGSVYIGMATAEPPELDDDLKTSFAEKVHLKGFKNEVLLYECGFVRDVGSS